MRTLASNSDEPLTSSRARSRRRRRGAAALRPAGDTIYALSSGRGGRRRRGASVGPARDAGAERLTGKPPEGRAAGASGAGDRRVLDEALVLRFERRSRSERGRRGTALPRRPGHRRQRPRALDSVAGLRAAERGEFTRAPTRRAS